jgi:hypothetical protein
VSPNPPLDDGAVPLPAPPPIPLRRGTDLGIQLLPQERLQAFHASQLEEIILHWLHECRKRQYTALVRFSGPNDRGRDVVGIDGDCWDNYQSKSYAHALAPADIWPEVGKIVYWSHVRKITVPRRSYFVAPKGASAASLDLLQDPGLLRQGIVDKWDTISSRVTRDEPPLTDELRWYIDRFDFSIFGVIPGEAIIEDLKDTPMYPVFFGGPLMRPRPLAETPPDAISHAELTYIGALIDAYSDHCTKRGDGPIRSYSEALSSAYGENLRRSRREFYSAESLREFARDQLPRGTTYEELQDELYDGVIDVVEQDHPEGLTRLRKTLTHATLVQLSAHPLEPELRPTDRKGMCHQLANDSRVRWKQ